jgi:hypothetical protein
MVTVYYMKAEQKILYYKQEAEVEAVGLGEGFEKRLKNVQMAYVNSIRLMEFTLLVASVTTLLTPLMEAVTMSLTFNGCARLVMIPRQLKKLLKHKG